MVLLFITSVILFAFGHWVWGLILSIISAVAIANHLYWNHRDPLGMERLVKAIQRTNAKGVNHDD